MPHRYHVKHGDSGGYIVQDTMMKQKRVIVFRSDSKRACITKAQELNGFTPVDGLEQTYAQQVTQANASRGR